MNFLIKEVKHQEKGRLIDLRGVLMRRCTISDPAAAQSTVSG